MYDLCYIYSTGAFDPQDDTNDYKNVFTIIVFCVLRIELFEWKWNFKESVCLKTASYTGTPSAVIGSILNLALRPLLFFYILLT